MMIVKNSTVALLVFGLLALGSAPTRAQTVTMNKPYVPKFMRVTRPSEVLDIQNCTPEYPKNSARNDEEGTVIFTFNVTPEGKVQKIDILKSSGFPELDNAAATSFASCKFRPATIAGKPVQAAPTVAHEWKIE